MKLLWASLFALGIAFSAFASPTPPPMRESVAVCDPAYPQQCLKPGPIVPVRSTALESSHVLKSSPGILFSTYVTSSAAGYLMLLDSATVPANGAVTPVECLQVPANTTLGLAFSGIPYGSFVNGITAVYSSTGCFTLTLSTNAFFSAIVQ